MVFWSAIKGISGGGGGKWEFSSLQIIVNGAPTRLHLGKKLL